MTDNNGTNEKLVHVNSYTKDDGTKVKEHWRGKKTYNEELLAKLNALQNNITDNNNAFIFGLYEKLPVKTKQSIENTLVENANKNNKFIVDLSGQMISAWQNLPNAYALYKVASPNLNYNPEYVRKNGQLFNSASELGDKKLEQKIKARLLLENTSMQDCKVFVANENSSISQKIANSNELKTIIKKDIEFIRKLRCFPAVGSDIEFTSPDLYNALHGANITEAKFDKQGNLNIKIEDLYNFNKGRTSFRGRIGEKLQSLGSLEPYYIVVDVKIPKLELDKY